MSEQNKKSLFSIEILEKKVSVAFLSFALLVSAFGFATTWGVNVYTTKQSLEEIAKFRETTYEVVRLIEYLKVHNENSKIKIESLENRVEHLENRVSNLEYQLNK